MPQLPTGTVTFLFTDIEGSTKRWERVPEAMAAAVARHDALLRDAIEPNGGYVFKTVGDAFCAAFPTALPALGAALAAQRALAAEAWGETGAIRVRMALHVGVAEERDSDYFGQAVNRVARLLSAGHGGQVLLSLPAEQLVRDALPAGAQLRDLGEHRLKDLARPEQIFQIVVPDLPSDFAPLATLDYRPNNLPVQLTPFIGREREVAALRERMGRDDVRLVTLTGPGGTGKTRLSLHVGAELIETFADGVFFVPLDQIVDPDLVVPAIAQALGVREEAGQPLLTTIEEALRAKQRLLVLDNFEQVTDAAPLIAQLLQACPQVKVLVSSRTRLRVQGEHEYAVPPLGLPDRQKLPPVEELARYEAIRLFVERAQAAQADFALTAGNARAVAGICHGLDGLPLAIELAAARVRLLPPPAMLARLEKRLPLLTGGGRDRPERQQTLHGAIAWSHDLLTPTEQTLFARLSVFAGGCTLEAAEAVCGGGLGLDLLEGVESLADKSLLRQPAESDGTPRFAMLATIREFGLEQLAAGGEMASVRAAHAAYYLALAEEAEPGLWGPEQGDWLNRLEAEHDNLRSGLAWLEETGDAECLMRLAAALRTFWTVRGHLGEGRSWLRRALAREDGVAPAALARALSAAGWLAWGQSDLGPAAALLERSLALYQQIGDRLNTANTFGFLGSVARDQGEFELAQGLYEDSLALFRELGDQSGIGDALNWLGVLAFMQGQYEQAAALYEENLAIHRRLQDHQMVAYALFNLAETRHHQGDHARALALYQEVLPLFRELGDKPAMAEALFGLGRLALTQGDNPEAGEFLRESLGQAWEVGNRSLVAGCLEGLAGVAGTRGDGILATRVLGAAEALRAAIGAPRQPAYQADFDQYLATARAALDGPAFAEAWAAGQALGPEEAVGVIAALDS